MMFDLFIILVSANIVFTYLIFCQNKMWFGQIEN